MGDVEGGHVGVLLAEHKKHGVQEVGDSDPEVPPAELQKPIGDTVVCVVVDALADEVVASAEVGSRQEVPEEVCVKEYHGQVVKHHDRLDALLIRLTILHEARPSVLEQVHVTYEQGNQKWDVTGESPS